MHMIENCIELHLTEGTAAHVGTGFVIQRSQVEILLRSTS